jgi:hypothetical protein
MTYVPDCENDIFISYAHADNRPLTEGQKGWIEYFHQYLEARVSMLLGEQPSIWRDKKLRGNDQFGEELLEQLSKNAILVSILSPTYLKSEWCLKELNAFLAAQKKAGDLPIKNKSRIFKIVKTYVAPQMHPEQLKGLLGYEFYETDPITGRPREFSFDSRDDKYQQLRQKLEDVAWEIRELLELLRYPDFSPSRGEPAESEMTIYLAETTSDLAFERDTISRELKRRGHSVVPDIALSLNAEKLRSEVNSFMDRAAISIHLVGANYGHIPEGETISNSVLQNEVAERISRERQFLRVIWIPIGIQVKDQRQSDFINYLEMKSANRGNVELLKTTLEHLKTFIKDRLPSMRQDEQHIEIPMWSSIFF